MTTEVIVALIGLAGSAIGTLGGILITNRLTTYRLSQLEKKVDKHNNLVERMTIVEQRVKATDNRLDDLVENLERFLTNKI